MKYYLIEPFHQDFNENSDQIIKPFRKELSLQKKREPSPSSTSLQMRGDLASIASKERHSQIHQSRTLIAGKDANSKESDEVCFELASNGSKESSNSSILKPVHQDFNENSDKILLAPFRQELSLQKKRISNPSFTSLQMRGELASTSSKERHSPIHQSRKLISGKDANSKESDEVCFEFASNGSTESTTPSLIEPFHQDFNENSDQLLPAPFRK